jgi:hypothetical protein
VPLLFTGGSGWFPFCGLTKKPDTSIKYPYYHKISLKKGMEWWWLVKTWSASVDLSWKTEGKSLVGFDTHYGKDREFVETIGKPTVSVDDDQQTTNSMTCLNVRQFLINIGGTYRWEYILRDGSAPPRTTIWAEQPYNVKVWFSYGEKYGEYGANKALYYENNQIWLDVNISGGMITDEKQLNIPTFNNAEKRALTSSANLIIDGTSVNILSNFKLRTLYNDSDGTIWPVKSSFNVVLSPIYF